MAERLTITRMSRRGDGVADTAHGPAYVRYALPGETVMAEPIGAHPDQWHLLHVEHGSHERIAPVCPHFGFCGGCAMQHWSLPDYHKWKRSLVIEALADVGLDVAVDALIDAHGQGRRRAVLHARCGPSGTINVGFAAPRSHQIVAIDRCPILTAGLERATLVARAIAEALEPANKPLDIHVTATDTGMDVDVRGSSRLNARLGSELARIAERHKLARLTRHGELIAQQGQPVVTIGRVQVPLPAGAFLQATAEGEETLARLARDYIGNAKMVADLFCGIGPFALRLAERARVTAVDIDETAIAALKRGAAGAKGLKPIDASARDLFRRPLTSKELRDFDAVVFDPPRQGAEAQARELAGSAVRVAVAVSCDPVTFARDAKILIEGGYRLTAVTPVDQFRYSHHVEIVARFER